MENSNALYLALPLGAAARQCRPHSCRTIITHIMPHRFKGMMWGEEH